MKAIIRCCCPCCLRGEPEEKARVKVSYDDEKSPNHTEESVRLLKPDEQPEDAIKENEETVKKDDDTPETNHNEEDEDSPKNRTRDILEMTKENSEDDGSEVVEYVDENGRRVRRIVKKTITTTISIRSGSSGDGTNNVKTETTEITVGGNGQDKNSVFQPRKLQERDVFLDFDTTPKAREERLINFEVKGEAFPKHDVKTVENKGYTTTITTGSPGGKTEGNSYSSVYKRTVVTKTIGGPENRSVVEHSTTSSRGEGEQPIWVVKKEKSKFDVPEWMEESKSPEEKRKNPELSDISVQLKYPGGYKSQMKEPDEKANESKIRPAVATREKPDISILSLEKIARENEKKKDEIKGSEKTEVQSTPPLADKEADDDDEDEEEEDEEEDEEEYDEFEEEIVVMEVTRKARFPKALETPKPEPEKVGVPIEDLLEIPTLQVQQESAPVDELFFEEKIEAVERQPQVFSEAPDFSSFGLQ